MKRELFDRFLMKYGNDNTLKNYRSALNTFYNYLLEEKKHSFDTDEELFRYVKVNDIEDYFYNIEKVYKKSTVNQKLEVAREFLSYIYNVQHITKFNLSNALRKFSREEIVDNTDKKYTPKKYEIEKLIEATYKYTLDGRGRNYLDARNRFYIALLTVTGLRADKECLDITMDEIEMVDGGYMINIPKCRVKNKIDKRVPIPPSIIKYFEDYKIERMIANEKHNTNLLFFTNRGNKMDAGNMNIELKKLCEKANIKNHITNHCFRYFLTQYLEDNGVPDSMIYKIIGWKEDGMKREYNGKANDKRHDKIKLEVCDVFK